MPSPPQQSSERHGHRTQRPHPRETLARCSLRAQLRGDPMLGTAFPAARLLLVEQPGAWGHGGLAESHFDRRVVGELYRRAERARVRVLARRPPGRTAAGSARRWALADTRAGRESLTWGTFSADAELLDLDLSPPRRAPLGDPDRQPLYLVCAHGRHDACCAIRGRPVAAALAEQRPGRVWECSHLGGDRFAANVLVLPAGLLYGRLLPAAAPEFAAAADADEVLTPLLRGRVGLPPVAQAALAFGYEYLALRARAALRVVRIGPAVPEPGVPAPAVPAPAVSEPIEVPAAGAAGAVSVPVAHRRVVQLSGPPGLVDVTVRVERTPAAGLTCLNPRPNYFLAYRLERIDILE